MRRRLYCFYMMVAMLLSCLSEAKAQDNSSISMYWAVPNLYNPSIAGGDSALHVSAIDRNQWVGLEGAPHTFHIAADMPFVIKKHRIGVGVNVLNNTAGISAETDLTESNDPETIPTAKQTVTTNNIGVQLSYSMRLWGGRLAMGVQTAIVNQSIKQGSGVSGTTFDIGGGVYYDRKIGRSQLYAGVSATHLNEAVATEMEEYAYCHQQRSYYFLAGCNIPLRNTLFLLQPSVLLKTYSEATTVDCTLRATYHHRFWGGVSYRYDDAVSVMLGADIHPIRIGYAYDIGISSLSKTSKGSHELLASYVLKLDLNKNKSYPKKSIRLL